MLGVRQYVLRRTERSFAEELAYTVIAYALLVEQEVQLIKLYTLFIADDKATLSAEFILAFPELCFSAANILFKLFSVWIYRKC